MTTDCPPCASEPLRIGSRLELFLDEELIEHLEGARRHLHEPCPAGVAIRADRPWDGLHNWGFQVIPDGDLFRMYYRAWPVGPGAPDLIALGYAESPDGKSWSKPDLGLMRIEGSCANNLCAIWPTPDGSDRDSRRAPLCGRDGHGMLVSKLAPFLDARPGVPHGERAKAIRPVSVRLGVAGSPIPGFTFTDCRQLIGDEIEGAVRWSGGGLSQFAARPVRLLFRLADACSPMPTP